MSEQGEDEVRPRWSNYGVRRPIDGSSRSQESMQQELHGGTRDAKRPGERSVDDKVLKRQRKQELINKMRQDTNELSYKTALASSMLQVDLARYGTFGRRKSPEPSTSQILQGQLRPVDFPYNMSGDIPTYDFEVESHQRLKELLARQMRYVEDLCREKAKRALQRQETEASVAAYQPLQQPQRQRHEIYDSISSFHDRRPTASQRQSPSLYTSRPKSDADLLLSLGRHSKRSQGKYRMGVSPLYPQPPELEPPSRQLSDRLLSSRGLGDDGNVQDKTRFSRNRNDNVQRATESKPTIRLAPGEGICLSVPSDLDMLSCYQRMIREAMEFFQVESVDLLSNIQGRTKNVEPGQIGLRCRHCAHRPFHWRGRGAVYFPGNLTCVYQSAQNMAVNHLLGSCVEISQELKEQLREARRQQEQESRRSGGKKYWVETCRTLGLGEREGMNGVWLQ